MGVMSEQDIDLSGMIVEVEMSIDARIEAVWDLVTAIDKTAEWSPEATASEWVGGATGPAKGAVFRGSNRRNNTEWTLDCYVRVADRPHSFEWAVIDPERPSSVWRYDLKDNGEGSTAVRHRFQHGPNYSGVRWAISQQPDRAEAIIDRRSDELRRNMLATLDMVKQTAEGA